MWPQAFLRSDPTTRQWSHFRSCPSHIDLFYYTDYKLYRVDKVGFLIAMNLTGAGITTQPICVNTNLFFHWNAQLFRFATTTNTPILINNVIRSTAGTNGDYYVMDLNTGRISRWNSTTDNFTLLTNPPEIPYSYYPRTELVAAADFVLQFIRLSTYNWKLIRIRGSTIELVSANFTSTRTSYFMDSDMPRGIIILKQPMDNVEAIFAAVIKHVHPEVHPAEPSLTTTFFCATAVRPSG